MQNTKFAQRTIATTSSTRKKIVWNVLHLTWQPRRRKSWFSGFEFFPNGCQKCSSFVWHFMVSVFTAQWLGRPGSIYDKRTQLIWQMTTIRCCKKEADTSAAHKLWNCHNNFQVKRWYCLFQRLGYGRLQDWWYPNTWWCIKALILTSKLAMHSGKYIGRIQPRMRKFIALRLFH